MPSRPGLRPTPDRVRETLFNWLGQRLDGLVCLDLFAGSGALLWLAGRLIDRSWPFCLALAVAMLLLAAGTTVDLSLWLDLGVHPVENSYGASIFALGVLVASLEFALLLMAAFVLARRLTGRLDTVRRLSFDTTRLLWSFALVQAVATVLLTHLFARLG